MPKKRRLDQRWCGRGLRFAWRRIGSVGCARRVPAGHRPRAWTGAGLRGTLAPCPSTATAGTPAASIRVGSRALRELLSAGQPSGAAAGVVDRYTCSVPKGGPIGRSASCGRSGSTASAGPSPRPGVGGVVAELRVRTATVLDVRVGDGGARRSRAARARWPVRRTRSRGSWRTPARSRRCCCCRPTSTRAGSPRPRRWSVRRTRRSPARSRSTARRARSTGGSAASRHNWGSRAHRPLRVGPVAGFDGAPDSFLECATARLKFGPCWTPPMTLLVLRVEGERDRAQLAGAGGAGGWAGGDRWARSSRGSCARGGPGRGRGADLRPARPSSGSPTATRRAGRRACLNSKIAVASCACAERGAGADAARAGSGGLQRC